ncbi:hypothetical protein Q5752_000139 [Cryptotrichosporon argae]
MPPRQTRLPTPDALLPPILALLAPPAPNAYSAHQKALTTTARLAAAGHAALAADILAQVARELLRLGEAASGAELGARMCEIMGAAGVGVDDKSRASVTQLLALTPAAGPWRKKLVDAAVKWSAAAGGCPTGDPGLHQYIGELYYKDRLFVPAEQHLLASGKRDAAALLADLMFEWSDKGAHDPAPYAIKGTLPFLAQTPPNILPATTFLTRFLSLLSAPGARSHALFKSTLPSQTSFSPPDIHLTSSPALNFLQLALITVQRAPAPGVSGVHARGTDGGVAREWENLVARYRRLSGAHGVLAESEVQEVLDQIGANVFHIPQRGNNDMLQNLMGSLFGGGGGGGAARALGAR